MVASSETMRTQERKTCEEWLQLGSVVAYDRCRVRYDMETKTEVYTLVQSYSMG